VVNQAEVVRLSTAPIVVRNMTILDAVETSDISPSSRALNNVIGVIYCVSTGDKWIADRGDMMRRAKRLAIEADSRAQLRFPLFSFLLQASKGSFHHDLVGIQTVWAADTPFGLDRRANISVLRTSMARFATSNEYTVATKVGKNLQLKKVVAESLSLQMPWCLTEFLVK
jgi:hypothetical protein